MKRVDIFLLLLLLLHARRITAVVRFYELNITSERYGPDCSDHLSSALMVNNQLPGDTIYMYAGDQAQILVRNNILVDSHSNATMGVSVHFHGIRQVNSNFYDGVPYVTQKPILPGESFLYKFEVPDQIGTFFYHAHVGLQEMSVFGPIIIYPSNESDPRSKPDSNLMLKDGPFDYDDERVLLLSEWWHTDRGKFEEYYLGSNFTRILEADSVLINGQGVFDSSVEMGSGCRGFHIVPVDTDKTYRLRIIGAMTFRTLGFAIADHKMQVIEVDGEYITPYEVDFLEVSPGQRFSVLISTDKPSDSYGIKLVRRWAADLPSDTNGHAILQYQIDNAADTFKPWFYDHSVDEVVGVRFLSPVSKQPVFPQNDTVHWQWNNLQPYYGTHSYASVGVKSNRTIKLRGTSANIGGLTRWYINGVSFSEGGHDGKVILHEILNGTRPEPRLQDRNPATGYDASLGTYPLDYMEVVDIVIQTTHAVGEPCRSHPWHTHGHSHWEIAYGSGEYTEERDGDLRNVPNPILKDLTLAYPGQDELESAEATGEIGCGWTKIRIVADNPGVWAMHCHNTPHMFMGMMLVFEEAPHLLLPEA